MASRPVSGRGGLWGSAPSAVKRRPPGDSPGACGRRRGRARVAPRTVLAMGSSDACLVFGLSILLITHLYLAADRAGDPQLAARLRRRQPLQPRRRGDRRFPLSDDRAGAAPDSRVPAEFRRDRHLAGHPDPDLVFLAAPDPRRHCPSPLLSARCAADRGRRAGRGPPVAARPGRSHRRHRAPGRRRAVLKVSVTAPPAEGRANDALLQLLARQWELPRRDLAIVGGQKSRSKIVHIAGEPASLLQRLGAALAALPKS